jgi:caa(3)-type oxidase subunit IV
MQTRDSVRSPLAVWLTLIVATGITFFAGDFEGSGPTGRWLVVGVLALALFKGSLVALHFMELRHAPAVWRWSVLGWLWVVVLGIAGAYLKGAA